MTKDEVRRLLGEPGKISASDYLGDRWYYPDALGGNVKFDSDTERVTDWDEP